MLAHLRLTSVPERSTSALTAETPNRTDPAKLRNAMRWDTDATWEWRRLRTSGTIAIAEEIRNAEEPTMSGTHTSTSTNSGWRTNGVGGVDGVDVEQHRPQQLDGRGQPVGSATPQWQRAPRSLGQVATSKDQLQGRGGGEEYRPNCVNDR